MIGKDEADATMVVGGAGPLSFSRRGGRLSTIASLSLIGIELALAVFGPALASYDPELANPTTALLPPSPEHWFGTNSYGADVFSRTLAAARLDLLIGFFSVGIALVISLPLGAWIGYSRGWTAAIATRILEFIQAFPPFIIAMALVGVAGPSATNVIVVLALLNLPIFGRLVRAETIGLRDGPLVEAERSIGSSQSRIVLLHLLPNAMSSAVAQVSVSIGWALLLTAGLSFVGAGVQAPTAEWGLMISEGAPFMLTGEWWVSLFPGLALGLAVLAFSLAGRVVSDRLGGREP
jgi:peptide/nickel transport system permease protein